MYKANIVEKIQNCLNCVTLISDKIPGISFALPIMIKDEVEDPLSEWSVIFTPEPNTAFDSLEALVPETCNQS